MENRKTTEKLGEFSALVSTACKPNQIPTFEHPSPTPNQEMNDNDAKGVIWWHHCPSLPGSKA